MNKLILLAILFFASLINCEQAWAQQYNYKAPEGWGTEKIAMPFKFAANIPYKGFEELRFAPGWGDSTSAAKQRWAYTLLWCLEGKQQFTEAILKKDLETYYSGLSHMTMVDLKMDTTKWIAAKAWVQKKSPTTAGDKVTYATIINFFDAHVLKKPAKLYGQIHIKKCPDASWTYVLIEISAYPLIEDVWQLLDKINDDFTCTK